MPKKSNRNQIRLPATEKHAKNQESVNSSEVISLIV